MKAATPRGIAITLGMMFMATGFLLMSPATPAGALTFQPPVDVAAGWAPYFIATADVNGDGKQDMVVADHFAGLVSVFLGGGDGASWTRRDVASHGAPYSLQLADINGDGKLDIVISSTDIPGTLSGGLTVLLGDGQGGFALGAQVATGSSPATLAVGDLNGDGRADVAVPNYYSGTVSIVLGDGSGGFLPKTDLNVGNNPQAVAIADMNMDGKPDLIVVNHSNLISVFTGNGTGAFPLPPFSVGYPVGDARCLAVGDVNGDNKLDVVTADAASQTVAVLLGSGTGYVGFPSTYTVGANPYSVAIADLNADGLPDVVAANAGGSTVSVLLGTGGGGFASQLTFAAGNIPWSVAVSDLNGDGRRDLVVADEGANAVSVLLNERDCPNSVSLTTDLNPSHCHATVNFTATTSPAGATGTVTILDGGNPFGSAPLDTSGMSIFSYADLPVGAHTITARFDGEGCASRTSDPVTEQVDFIPTSGTMTSDANPARFGTKVTLSADIHLNGSITFFDGTIPLGTVPTAATLSVTTFSIGKHDLTATYSGDGCYGPSTTPVYSQVIVSDCTPCDQVAFVLKWGVFGPDSGQFKYPTGVATDPTGNVYVAEQGNNRIQKFSSTGTYLTQWGTGGSGPGQFNRPYGVATDNSGYVYVTDADNHRVEKFTNAGVYVTNWGTFGSGDGQFNTPALLTTDSAGDVYVVDYGNDRIQRFTGTGTFVTKWGSLGTGNGQFTFPTGIAVDAAHNVYVSDYNNHRIEKFTDTGTYLAQWGAFGTGNGQFNSPAGVATDCFGDVYVADLGNQRVEVFSGSGTYVNQWGSLGTGDGMFDTLIGVASDSAGNVYVADSHNHRMQAFACSSAPASVGDRLSLVYVSLLTTPNPFTRSTQIAMTTVRAMSNANVSVLDVSGRVVRTLHRGPLAAGTRQFTWDGSDDQGRQVGNGLYFVSMRSREGSLARKMIRVQ